LAADGAGEAETQIANNAAQDGDCESEDGESE
jgi:hypothetical protein